MALRLCHLHTNQYSLRHALSDPDASRQTRMARNSLGRRHSFWTPTAASLSSFRQRARVGPRRTPLCAAGRILEAGSEPRLTMATTHSFLSFRLAHSALRLALRVWPEESRQWGLVRAAELDEIQQPAEALQWALGGLVIFTRASALHFLAWLKLPAGSRADLAPFAPGTTPPLLPKHS